MPEGCDVSEHQGNLSAEWFGQWSFCIIRAYNENGYPDRTFQQNWARAAGRTLRGVYGWPIPGGDNRALGAQLVRTAPGAEAGYWADVEHSAQGIPSAADVEAYLRGIGDHPRGFYSNIGECPRSPFLERELWWMADYGPNNGQRHDPNAQPPRPTRGWAIHQYTSNPLDLNYASTLDFVGDTDMPLSLSDFDGVKKVVGGDPNVDGTIPTISQVVGDLVGARQEIAALSAKVDAIGGTGVALDYDELAKRVAAELADRLKD